MQATSKDLKIHTSQIISATMRGEEVIITYRGKPCAKIIPIKQVNKKNKKNEFCGIWEDRSDMIDVKDYVRKIRQF